VIQNNNKIWIFYNFWKQQHTFEAQILSMLFLTMNIINKGRRNKNNYKTQTKKENALNLEI